jgi:F0F1-type ATP synthase membrane subunit c/vacuolar-type H+-ATPase subunit K
VKVDAEETKDGSPVTRGYAADSPYRRLLPQIIVFAAVSGVLGFLIGGRTGAVVHDLLTRGFPFRDLLTAAYWTLASAGVGGLVGIILGVWGVRAVDATRRDPDKRLTFITALLAFGVLGFVVVPGAIQLLWLLRPVPSVQIGP